VTYQLDTARVMIDDRLRDAAQYRVARALRLKTRAERTTRRARRALTNLTA
jgi:hypothetical protein